jgi:ATPase family associated with various cellular activities (AAA)
MSHSKLAPAAPLDDEAGFYLSRIKQIDRIIEGPVKTLIGFLQRPTSDGKTPAQNRLYFPTWVAAESKPFNEDNRLTQSICFSTLQRVRRFRRRFSWLGKSSEDQLDRLRDDLVQVFTPKKPGDFDECAELLNSEAFGGLNPLTASRIFRILLEHGEGSAHSGIGFLAFFAMIWPLSRTYPNRLTAGARIEPWYVSTYVTAKCVLPIRKLQDIIERRATLYDEITVNLSVLKRTSDKDNPRDNWLFKIALDDLSANLSHLSNLAIDKDAFADCARTVQEYSQKNAPHQQIYQDVLEKFCAALEKIRETSKSVLTHARDIVDTIDARIAQPLRAKQKDLERHKGAGFTTISLPESLTETPLNLRFANEHAHDPKYWEDLADAADQSVAYCKAALTELEEAGKICPRAATSTKEKPEDLYPGITQALSQLAHANRKVKQVLNLPVQDAALWCRSVVDREIAHASAENFTDFDPSELVNGIAVAIAWNLMSTRLQVSDAVTKAIAGARKDGSWRSGKPYYSRDHATGIWAMTSDIVWSLTTAIKHFPAVREADEELFNFVDWLERTQVTFSASTEASGDSIAGNVGKEFPRHYVGWPSERLRDRGKIHLGTTALSINALIDIRNLAEYRLWELCQKRFTVLSPDKPLRDIEPVDLGATHRRRLHRRLERMAYRARINHDEAEYSLVLHGPPGSSKTKLAEALSAEMWKFSNRWGASEPRLIRITPADFTRKGEDRLDSEARAIFDLLGGIRAVTIFFDEIDDLLRQRKPTGDHPTFMELVVPAMLNRLADLRSACPRQEISFILATNYVENIDSALIRKGRIDASIPVVYPDFSSRVAISINEFRKSLNRKNGTEERRKNVAFLEAQSQTEKIAERTQGWPYLTVVELCRFLVRELHSETQPSENFEKILQLGLTEYGASFSAPIYNDRLNKGRQELLNEFVHHIISLAKDPPDPDKCFAELVDLSPKLKQLLSTVLVNEERGPA